MLSLQLLCLLFSNVSCENYSKPLLICKNRVVHLTSHCLYWRYNHVLCLHWQLYGHVQNASTKFPRFLICSYHLNRYWVKNLVECGGGCYNWSVYFDRCLFTKFYWGDQISEDGMGETCSTNVEDEKCIKSFVWEIIREETVWKTLAWIQA
jgi:hypothetical protein